MGALFGLSPCEMGLHVDWIPLLLTLPSAIYAAVLIRSWWRLRQVALGENNSVAVTVIVPVRNEAANVGACLRGLAAQRFPADRLQVVVVDDRSEDQTVSVVRAHAPFFHGLEIVELADEPGGALAPKKEALLAGLARAKHQLVALLDGDCVPEPSWLASVTGQFEEGVAAVTGPVLFGRAGVWGKLVELEFLGLQVAGWLAFATGEALTASAANLAFRKPGELSSTALRADLASGDDVFLAQSLAAKGRVRPLVRKEAVVRTAAPASVAEFLLQRLRWASKLLSYSPSRLAVLALAYAYQVLLVGTLFAGLKGALPVSAWVGALAPRLAADLLVVGWAAQRLGILRRLVFLPFAEVLLCVEVLLAPLAFFVPFRWKGRRYGPGGKVLV